MANLSLPVLKGMLSLLWRKYFQNKESQPLPLDPSHLFFLPPQGLCSTCLFSLLLALKNRNEIYSFFSKINRKKSSFCKLNVATNFVPLHSPSPANSTSLKTLDFNLVCLSLCSYISSASLPQLLPIILPPNWSSSSQICLSLIFSF